MRKTILIYKRLSKIASITKLFSGGNGGLHGLALPAYI
jgi:hypothetical protein